MIKRSSSVCSIVGLLILIASGACPAKDIATRTPPDLTNGGKRDKLGDINLGPTGARGWIWGWNHQSTLARQILVTVVKKNTPAAGVLKAGDVILGVGEKPFADDARIAFGRAITDSESEEEGGVLRLIRWRNGSRKNVTITLPVKGSYSDSAPYDCAKSARIREEACRYLARTGLGGGIAGSVNALGLLATGKQEYMDLVKRHARKEAAAGRHLKLSTTSGMAAWHWSYSNLFLTEYYLATGDKSVLNAIREYSVKIASGQSGVGTWGHGMAWPDIPWNNGKLHGRLGGYGAINQAGLSCFLSLVLAKKCGIEKAVIDQAIERARVFFKFYVNKGAIPYGDHNPYMAHDDNGKCSLAAIIFDLLGDREAASYFSRTTVASYGCREHGHTGNYLSFLWGTPGAARSGPDATGAFMKEVAWFYDLERQHDGGFTYQGKPGQNIDGAEHQYGGWNCTGARLLAYSLPLRKLYITGKGDSVCRKLTGKAIDETIEAGRDFSWWNKSKLYNHRTETQLLAGLKNWSPIVRYYSAAGLASKRGDFVSALKTMLESPDLNARYGACRALEAMGKRSAPAVDALIAQLSHKDVWLRIRATCALSRIGQPARKALPALLRVAVTKSEEDPRQITQRYLSGALLDRGGLLKESIRDVDRDALIQAVRMFLQNDDGRSRTFVASVFNEFNFDELAPFWPDILQAVKVSAPSGVMFAHVIRTDALEVLAKHRVREGIDAAVTLAWSQNQWASEHRTPKIMNVLKQYGAASKRTLPELRKFADFCRTEPGFPEACRRKKTASVEDAIKAIEAATETPPLRSIAPFIKQQKSSRKAPGA